MSKLYDALEICLQALEQGAELDVVLERYPELAGDLRPVLEASIQARTLQVEGPSADVLRRGRASLLERAAALRAARRPAPRSVISLFQRLAIALTLTAIFLISGTGLVSASSGSLPGDSLYPVKRTWEDLRLLFIFDSQRREAVEGEYENERLEEVFKLVQQARVVSITFTGVVTEQQVNQLVVSGVVVNVSAQAQLPGDPAIAGMAVVVTGHTQAEGIVLADSVQILPPGSLVPTGQSAEIEARSSSDSSSGDQTKSSSGPDAPAWQTEDQGRIRSFHLEGTVDSIQENIWTINGQTVYVENVQIPGSVTVGSKVDIEGYFTAEGRFIVTKIEVEEREAEDGGSTGGDNGDDGNNGGDDDEDDRSGDDSEDDGDDDGDDGGNED